MSSTVTCVYSANAYNRTPAQLAVAIGSPPLDPTFLAFFGVTVGADNTVAGATNAVRTIVLNFTAAFKSIFPDVGCDQRGPFWNFMTGIIEATALTPVLAAAPVLA